MNSDSSKKRILILASKLGYQTRSVADAAKSLEIEVAFGTDRCHKLDDPWGDGAMALHLEKPEDAASEIVRETQGRNLDAILALGDRPTATAAYADRALSLKGNSPEAVGVCRNKLRQRETLIDAGLLVPRFFSFPLAEKLIDVVKRVTFPCVVKPMSLSASQGVIRANNLDEFRAAIDRIHALYQSPEIVAMREPSHDRVLVEEYIPGDEVSVEALITEGRARILAIFDKPDPLEGPYFEETIYVTPSRLPQQTLDDIADCASKSIAAIGLVHGPVHAEFRINDAGVWPLDIAPRPIGGLCSRALRFGDDKISLEELILRHALDLPGSGLLRENCAAGVMMIPVPRSGILECVEGIEEAKQVSGIEDVLITARLHDYIAAWPEGSSYPGFIFSRSDSPEAAEAALREAHAKLNFVITPRLPVEHPATRRFTA